MQEAALAQGEARGRCRCPGHLRKDMDSPIADIAEHGRTAWAAACSPACSCSEFVGEGITWAHLDIAGPAFNEGAPFGYTPKGGTGVAVRTLLSASPSGGAPAT